MPAASAVAGWKHFSVRTTKAALMPYTLGGQGTPVSCQWLCTVVQHRCVATLNMALARPELLPRHLCALAGLVSALQ